MNYSLKTLLAIAAACFGAMPNVSAQTAAGPHRTPTEFEAASINLSPRDSPYRADNDLDGEQQWIGTGLRANANFQAYILFAYNITDAPRARAVWDSLPPWAKFDKYEIQAVAFPGVTRAQMRGMMVHLLEERFALRTHTETKVQDALTISLLHAGVTGPQLRPHASGESCVDDATRPDEIPAPQNGKAAPRYCGATLWNVDGQRHLQVVDATMPEIAAALASESLHGGFTTPHTGTEVSGLTGKYDLDLQYVPADRADEAGGITYKEALKKQAGLVLVERRQPMQIIVIDHLEKPTPN